MGNYQYIDPRTGQGYDFEIAGDIPTDSDFAKMAQVLERDRLKIAAAYEDAFGEPPEEFDDGTAIGRGFARGKKQIKGAIGETLGTIGEKTGLGFLEDYGEGLEERAQQELGELILEQPERLQSTDVDSVGSALQYAGEVVGEQIPQLGIGLGAAAAAPLVGLSGFVGGAVAAGTATAPILFGNNIQRQEDEVAAGKKASVDVGAALKATFGQATLEGIADKILLGGAFRSLGKSIFTRTASRVGSGATTEGLTEVGQQMMERAQAGLPIDSDDAIAEYREAAIAGGLIGGGTRATFGAIGERAPDIETDGTTRGQGTNVTQRTQTTPQLQEGQQQGELFPESEITAAQEKEARNEADPTPPKGKAEKTKGEIAQDSAVALATTADLTIRGGEGSQAQIYLIADDGDDDRDHWRISAMAGFSNRLIFYNSASGSYTDVVSFQTNGTIRPGTTNQSDLGSSDYRWANVYTNDLNLSNEGSTNNIDGTWGDFTIQEGETDLYLINNRSGKKYKFNLTEVS